MVESEVRVMATFNVKRGKRGLPVAIQMAVAILGKSEDCSRQFSAYRGSSAEALLQLLLGEFGPGLQMELQIVDGKTCLCEFYFHASWEEKAVD